MHSFHFCQLKWRKKRKWQLSLTYLGNAERDPFNQNFWAEVWKFLGGKLITTGPEGFIPFHWCGIAVICVKVRWRFQLCWWYFASCLCQKISPVVQVGFNRPFLDICWLSSKISKHHFLIISLGFILSNYYFQVLLKAVLYEAKILRQTFSGQSNYKAPLIPKPDPDLLIVIKMFTVQYVFQWLLTHLTLSKSFSDERYEGCVTNTSMSPLDAAPVDKWNS